MDFNLSSNKRCCATVWAGSWTHGTAFETSRAAAKTGPGWQPEVWRRFADELGILGVLLPESAGGSGGGPVEVMVIAEELGGRW